MSEQKTPCDAVIDQFVAEADKLYPHKDELVGTVSTVHEVDESARKLLTWIHKDPNRRAALATIANGSTCQLSAAREVRRRMIELHSSARTAVREPAMV